MPYCKNCGETISEIKAQAHYNLCDNCYQKLIFCKKCGRTISEEEIIDYRGFCASCQQQELRAFVRDPLAFMGKTPEWKKKLAFTLFLIIMIINAIMALLTSQFGFLFILIIIAIFTPSIIYFYKLKKQKQKS